MLALLACLPTAALQVDAAVLPPPARLNGGAAIQVLDGDLWAFGPDYKARLSGPSIEFVPALGERTAHNLPLTLNLVAMERGGSAFAFPGFSQRSFSGQRVSRQVSPTVVEQLDVDEAGLELSYLFTQRPKGDGDLVLRLALSSELPLSAEGAAGLTFSLPDLGGVHIGAVTGIDARGQRASGGLRLVQSEGRRQLELSLPDAFVDQAEFPLLLDPVIGPVQALDPTLANAELNPDAIWSQAGNRWAATWEVIYSAADHDVRARTLAANGALQGPVVTLEAGTTTLAKRPQIAAFDASNRLLVLWHQPSGLGGDVLCRSALSDLSSLSALVTVQSSGGTAVIDADVAGRRSAGQSGLAIWMFASGGVRDCRSRSITVPAVGDPTLGVTFQLASGDLNLPRLARFPDQQGRFFAAWRGLIGFTPTLFAARLASSGVALVNPSPIGIAGEILSLDIDHSPDAAQYLFTLSLRKTTPSGFKQEQISEVYNWTDNPPMFSGNFIFDAEFQDTILNAEPQGDLPSAGVLCGQSAFVTRASVSLGQPTQWSQNLQRYARATGQLISSVGASVSDPVLATGLAARSNGESTDGDELLFLYSSNGNVLAQPAEIYGQGPLQFLGVDCGQGGQVQATGPAVIGSPGLVVGHSGAPLGTLAAVLNLAYLPVPLTCGTCVWNPLQVTAVQPVIGQSAVPVVLPIPLNPALLGKSIELQWTLVGGVNSPCILSPNVSVSSRLVLTISE